MDLARHFPGLNISLRDVMNMTPEETRAIHDAGEKILKRDREERWAHTRLIATAGARR